MGDCAISNKFYLSPAKRRKNRKANSRRRKKQPGSQRGRNKFIDRDRLHSTPQAAVAKQVVTLFDRLQREPREVQLLSLASAFILMSETFGFSTSDTYAAVVNLMKDRTNATGRKTEFDAMKHYLETDVLHDG